MLFSNHMIQSRTSSSEERQKAEVAKRTAGTLGRVARDIAMHVDEAAQDIDSTSARGDQWMAQATDKEQRGKHREVLKRILARVRQSIEGRNEQETMMYLVTALCTVEDVLGKVLFCFFLFSIGYIYIFVG